MSGIRIVTGRTGQAHVTSYQMQSLYRGLFGDFALLQVGECFSAEKRSKNLVWIHDGVMLFQGIYAIIPYGEVTPVNIENVEPGYKRIDTICIQYTKNVITDTEEADIVVVKGEVSAATPVAPSITDGDRWEQDILIQVPLYDVLVELDDITLTSRMSEPYPTITEVFQSVSNGKTAIASAITDRGVQTDASDTFSTMADNIRHIPSSTIVVNDGFMLDNVTYSDVDYTAEGWQRIHIDSNTTINDIATAFGMNVRAGYQSPYYLYKEDEFTSGITVRFRTNSGVRTVSFGLYISESQEYYFATVSATDILYFKKNNYCLIGGIDGEDNYLGVRIAYTKAKDLNNADKWIYLSTLSYPQFVSEELTEIYNTTKRYYTSENVLALKKTYMSNNNYAVLEDAYFTEVASQTIEDTKIVTIDLNTYLVMGKPQNSPSIAFKIGGVS